jgi:predicted amidohydrolase YtcJ
MSKNAAVLPLISKFLLYGFAVSMIFCCRGKVAELTADKIFINGHVVTMDERLPEAEAFAVGRGKIIMVGTTEGVLRSYPDVKVVDLQKKTVLPGIIESHGHLLSLGQSFLELNVEGAESPQIVIQKVKERAAEVPKGEWIIGWGWDEGAWASNYPSNSKLSEVSPDNPVYIRGLHGFACWANKKALEIAGITGNTLDPPNGEILKNSQTGVPIGILTNEAQDLLMRHIPPLSVEQTERALMLALEECLKYGLTSVHEARTSTSMLKALRSLKAKGKLESRVYVMLDWTDEKLIDSFFDKGPEIDPDNILTIRCVKIFVDGALGSRGAAMLEPYSDAPGERGLIVTPEEDVYRLTSRALQSGMQIAVHAIGDQANRLTLDAFAHAIRDNPDAVDHRLRVEHAQIVSIDDIPRFFPLGIVVSMQPPHCTSDMPWAEERVGPTRIKGAYAWRSFLDTGVHLTLNSDFPGETLNPFFGMYAAMKRQTPEGKPDGGWYPGQCLSRDVVLKAYTTEAAYSGFEEEIKGKIWPGMLADFIVLSADILSIPVHEFLSLQVEETYLSGDLVYKKQ